MPVVGTRQSPIELHTKKALFLADPGALLRINYPNRAYPGHFKGDQPGHGHFDLDAPSRGSPALPTVTFRKDVFELRSVHIHFGAEHSIDHDPKKPDDGLFEVHLVHALKGNDLNGPKVVIGILYHPTGDSPSGGGLEALDMILKARAEFMMTTGRSKKPKDEPTPSINPLHFFPHLRGTKRHDLINWFHYEGSLTSEPYSEDVSWFVMRTKSRIRKGELVDLEGEAKQTARKPHALDSRIVVRSFKD